MRIEKDIIGEVTLNDDQVYGIQTYRAAENFPVSGEKVNIELILAYLQVKKAAAVTNFKYGLLSSEVFNNINKAIDLLIEDCIKCSNGESEKVYSQIIVDPYQGGAGTSLNMNMNEVIANKALILMGKKLGEYHVIHPLDDVNLSQSTNDTYPTALRIASIKLLRKLQESFSNLQNELQNKEREFGSILKVGRTQLQDAVPISLGQEFGAYAQAIARDRWRFYNAEERLRSVNLGGTAVGNSIAADKRYVLNVVNELREITGLPIAKSEDLIEATQNLDVFVEVHGIVKAGATSIIKMCNDLRLLSSGPNGGLGEIKIPNIQAGSTIMPGKVNPVILENTIQICEIVKGNDAVIANLVSQGNLELNQYLPLIAHLFLKSLTMINDTVNNLTIKCIAGIKADKKRCTENLMKSKAIAAALIPVFGYDRISGIVGISDNTDETFADILLAELEISEKELQNILKKELGIEFEIDT